MLSGWLSFWSGVVHSAVFLVRRWSLWGPLLVPAPPLGRIPSVVSLGAGLGILLGWSAAVVGVVGGGLLVMASSGGLLGLTAL